MGKETGESGLVFSMGSCVLVGFGDLTGLAVSVFFFVMIGSFGEGHDFEFKRFVDRVSFPINARKMVLILCCLRLYFLCLGVFKHLGKLP
jgi:hypothetical protein